MKLGILFSGGKDSTLALHKAKQFHKVVCLISLISKNEESYMFHVPNIELTKTQAEVMGLPLLQKITQGEKEKELLDLKKVIIQAKKEYQIEGLVTGAIRSVYQSSRIQKICHELDLWCFNPLWLKDQIEVLNELVDKKFKVIISGVFGFPLDESFLGKTIDKNLIKKLKELKEKYSLNPSGEGGELESTVLDAPFFKKRIVVLDYNLSYKNYSGTFIIKKIKLVKKCS